MSKLPRQDQRFRDPEPETVLLQPLYQSRASESPVESRPNDVKSRILSLSFDPERLQRRESALRAQGFEVKSVPSPGQARFEIEMGTCGIFVTCRLVPDIINRDLMDLFRRYCPADGFVIYVTPDNPPTSPYEPEADVRVPESRDPQGIVEAIRNHSQVSAARAN